MEWSRRYKKAWFKYARKYEEHIRRRNLDDYAYMYEKTCYKYSFTSTSKH